MDKNVKDYTHGNMFLNNSTFNKDVKINQIINPQRKINTIDNVGMTPSPRFGHSLTLINTSNAILFGGAVGDIDSCKFSNETFSYNLMTRIWMNVLNSTIMILTKIIASSEMPTPRAAHSAVANDNSQLIVHGGSSNSVNIFLINN